ncbi:MAG: protein kinase, partial [Ktedonobacterales bacterium]
MANEGLEPRPLGVVVRDRYRIEAVVGRGGLGTVYQVSDVIYGKRTIYALKELSDPAPGARKQFLLECQWLQALDHNHIPKVRENFEWNGRLYLVMDFVAGDNLEQALTRNGGRPLPERQVLRWMLPVCDALQYLHTRIPPILHRDVKPANIIVSPAGYSVLVDFGIAKEHLPGANQTATFVRKAGTEGYAPPEQYTASNQTGPWSDVYGVGATIFHLLTGEAPPTAVERVVQARLPHLREVNPAVSMATDAAVWKALVLRPSDRYQSIAEFAQPLMEALRAGSVNANSNPSPGITASYPSVPPIGPNTAAGPGGMARSAADTRPSAQSDPIPYPPLTSGMSSMPAGPEAAPMSSRLYGAGAPSPAPYSPLPTSRPSPARPITNTGLTTGLTGTLRTPSRPPDAYATTTTTANLSRAQAARRTAVTRDDLAIDPSAFPDEAGRPARRHNSDDTDDKPRRRFVTPIFIGGGLIATVAVIAILAIVLTQVFAPLDRSSPRMTITG